MRFSGISVWQNRLVPVMAGVVLVAGLFFAVVSVMEFDAIRAIMVTPGPDMTASLAAYDKIAPSTFDEAIEVARQKTAVILEHESITRRYTQAHGIILAQLWTRYMAFTTGAIMALIGSAFILGKLREDATSMAGSGATLNLSLTSTSPGLILAVLGSLLMGGALMSRFEVHTTDPPHYLATTAPTAEGTDRIPEDVLNGAPDAGASTTDAGTQK